VRRAGFLFPTTSKRLRDKLREMDHAKGYFFVEVEITDPAAYEAYRTKVPDIISAHGGKILVRGGYPQPLDGVMPHRRRVIVEFDSPEAVKTFYYSDAYQATQPIRLNESNGFMCLLIRME
jgi:uncharacterized protein (DUF1330 family)